MGGNNFQDRLRQREQQIFEAGIRIGIQQQWDYMQLVLRDEKYVDRDIFGRARMQKLFAGLKEYADHFHEAFTTEVEADVRQEELDRCLWEIWKDDLVPFAQRYDELKTVSYKRGKGKWR